MLFLHVRSAATFQKKKKKPKQKLGNHFRERSARVGTTKKKPQYHREPATRSSINRATVAPSTGISLP